jgi:hypothetical protein
MDKLAMRSARRFELEALICQPTNDITAVAQHLIPHRTSSRIALSSPANVSGYMRLLIICRIMRIE